MELIFTLAVITFLLWIGYKLTGAVLQACIWLFIKVPLAAVVAVLGLVCCCTLILIPIGLRLFKTALKLLIPGV